MSAACAPWGSLRALGFPARPGVRSHLRLRLSRRSQGRGTVALSDPPSQAPPAAPGETLTRHDQRPRLHPRSAKGRRRPRRHWSLGRVTGTATSSSASARGPYSSCMNDLHERKSRVTRATRLAGKTAAETISVMLAVFGRINPALRKSVTFDNDTAFAKHALLRSMRTMTTWFCDAYASWQKGGVENANGRLRRWLPRPIDIDQMSDEEIQDIVMTANLTPRKCLGFLTPFQAISKELGKDVQIRFA